MSSIANLPGIGPRRGLASLIAAPSAIPAGITLPPIVGQPDATGAPKPPVSIASPAQAAPSSPLAASFNASPAPAPIGAAPSPEPSRIASPSMQAVLAAQKAESQIKPPQYHGKLGVVERIGDVLGQTFVPGLEANLGVGTGGYERRLAQAEQATDRAEKENAEQATAQGTEARAAYDQAQADKLKNEPAPLTPERTPQQATFDVLNDPNSTPQQRLEAVQNLQDVLQAGQRPAPFQRVTLADKDGNPILASYDPETRQYLGSDGVPIQNPSLYVPAVHDTYHEWLASHPGKSYDDFLKAQVNDKKGTASGLSAYAAVRLLDDAYRYNPGLLPVLGQMIGQMGIQLSPEGMKEISSLPAGQPQNSQGKAVGLAQPEAPTTTSRNRGQQAADVMPNFDNAAQEITQLSPQLGPLMGRWTEFLTGKIGANYPQFAALRTNLDLLKGAYSRFHLNTEMGYKTFDDLLNAAQSPDNLLASLSVMRNLAQRYINTGAGRPGGTGNGQPQTHQLRLSSGKTVIAHVQNGRWVDENGNPIQ